MQQINSISNIRFNSLLDCLPKSVRELKEFKKYNPSDTVNKINELSRDRNQSGRITRFVDIVMTLPLKNVLTEKIMELPTTNTTEFQEKLVKLIYDEASLNNLEFFKLKEKVKDMIENKIPQLSAISAIDVCAFIFLRMGKLKDRYYAILGLSNFNF